MRLSRRGRMVTATLGAALVEWLLFELIRTPYNPPYDMSTFLGQEKYSAFALMGMIAAGWSPYVLYDGLRPLPAPRDALAFAAMLAVVAAAIAAVVFYPPWSVTPLGLLCK